MFWVVFFSVYPRPQLKINHLPVRCACGCGRGGRRAAGLLDVVGVEGDLLVEAGNLRVERDALVDVGFYPSEHAHCVEVLRVLKAEAHHSSVLLRDNRVNLALEWRYFVFSTPSLTFHKYATVY